ncbi:MAG: hypothetical protein PF505_06445, partial [Vallitaleaceae bacterium]|nr:hypothetical protein [Vallitaleaceae bacterium]
MIAIFIYGFGFVYLIARILGYTLAIYEVLLIVSVAYLFVITALSNKKRTLWIIMSLIILIGITNVVLIFTGYIEEVMTQVWLFVEPYYDSVFVGQVVDLGNFREGIILFLIAIGCFKVIESYKDQKYSYYAFTLLSIILVSLGFVSIRLSAKTDRLSVVIFAISQMVYFFYHYYLSKIKSVEEKRDDYKFTPFFVLVGYYGTVVVIIAFVLFGSVSYPFQKRVEQYSSTREQETNLYERYDYLIDRLGTINDSFRFKGMDLMSVHSEDETRYLKGIVYEVYDGAWHQMSPEEAIILPQTSLEAYGNYDHIDITYTTINTPVLFSAGYM